MNQKLVIIGPAHPFRGGLANYNERLATEFQLQGYDVVMHTFTTQYPELLFPGKSQFSDRPAPLNIDIYRTFSSINPFSWIKLGLRLKREQPDLIILRFWLPFMAPSMGTISRIARSNKKTKILALIDNIIPHEKRLGDTMLAKYFVGSVDGFVVMSRAVEADLNSFDKEKPVEFCPHPLFDNYGAIVPREEAIRKLKLDANSKYMLFFGFIRDYKGLDLLLKAMALPALKDPSVKLIVAGEFYCESEYYYALIKEAGLENRIVLRTEFIPDSEIPIYFGAADLIVQPYKSATQSGVTQVGYYFNKPMLVTNVGGLGEIIPHGKVGYVVEPNPSEIADAINDFYTNNRFETMSSMAEIEKARFSWANLVKSFEKLTSRIIATR
ncbi:glycosyltransferase [Williamwhitmania taraxaci]|uniref:Glycosyltransferase involved in cell wall bisynthesis n=1 Tax=Williamwhitmania taraxaci TaxID=1640674 RepID=A0A1G6GIM8_9BACT|nr:glycosyltransferase [Williamwhitmania taraxaci]SDB81605.1 Glycosyltransferase involved in cell wall bisynthesis [Williamwhitmania taraxaci]